MFVGVGEAFVIRLAIFVFLGVRTWVPHSPKGLDEVFTLFVCLQSFVGPFFGFGRDVSALVAYPFLKDIIRLRFGLDGFISRVVNRFFVTAFLRPNRNRGDAGRQNRR